MSVSKNTQKYSIPENVNSRTQAFWIGPQIKDMEMIDDKIFFRGELYAKKIGDKNREKNTDKKSKTLQEEEKNTEKPTEKPREKPTEKTTEKKTKKEEIVVKKMSSDIFIDTIGERSRIWGDIYCTVSKNKDILHKPILLYCV